MGGAPDIINRYPCINSMVEEASSEAVGGTRLVDRERDAAALDAVRERECGRTQLATDTLLVILGVITGVAAFSLIFLMFYG
jgi:hypothetical protein